MAVPSRRCCRPPLCKKRGFGSYPFLVTPVSNFEQLILYFHVSFADGTRRRAWLVPPTAVDQVATIQLETTAMSLGCSGTAPQQGRIQTYVAGVTQTIVQDSPVVFQVYNPDAGLTLQLGCAEDADGKLLMTDDPACPAGPATDTWFVLNNGNPLQPYLVSGVRNACTTQNQRVLRALPTVSSGVYELSWQPVASTLGLDTELTLVITNDCLPCDRQDLSSGVLQGGVSTTGGVGPG